ncbi:MAG: CDP-alcohol phosphatidyltransferase family protein [Candidatus Marithrix sp.]
MMMFKYFGIDVYKNIPNIVSILGILPLALLFLDNGYQYIIPLIIYNNIMDDLDGILAIKLGLKSDFGAKLDNVCDAVAHILLVMIIGMHYGLISGIIGLIAVIAILIRVISRLTAENGTGSPTNELIRHLLFTLLLAELFGFDPVLLLIIVFLLNSVSMLWPYSMPYMIRSQAKTVFTITMVNILLILAWLFPYVTPIIAGIFIASYLYSFVKSFPKIG